MSAQTYLNRIYKKAKPMTDSFTIEYKNHKYPQSKQEYRVSWTSKEPFEFKIGCSSFNIRDFLYTAKTTGYWGEYQVVRENDYESFPKWHISIEDFERIVLWLTAINEKKYYVHFFNN
jgi:hypothetical protein